MKSIHFNNAIREILKTYILEEDNFSECKIRKIWVEHFKDISDLEFPSKNDDGEIEKMFVEPGKEVNDPSDPYGNSSPEMVLSYLQTQEIKRSV